MTSENNAVFSRHNGANNLKYGLTAIVTAYERLSQAQTKQKSQQGALGVGHGGGHKAPLLAKLLLVIITTVKRRVNSL